METTGKKRRASREVWLVAALEVLRERGADGIRIVPLATQLGLTSGSFYWHFKNVQDLLDQVLEHWEHHLTDHIVQDAQTFDGPPDERILNLMLQVVREDAAVPDHAISAWARHDEQARNVYLRTVQKRFDFAKWMFEEAGFDPAEAQTRGRLMVTSLMGDASNDLKSHEGWENIIRSAWKVLVAR
ncbi:TetR/AcrR family transcriptional regulator [Primorskyibacter sp. S87]|uniref:TetR/AcrR family transcriptional regulator n=1 Tax=Primorskyibacter sp. S87 TaxID=3415126 RepID=UPI003C7DA21D